jgi:hypothetical protein
MAAKVVEILRGKPRAFERTIRVAPGSFWVVRKTDPSGAS